MSGALLSSNPPGTKPPKVAIVRQRYNPFGGAERFVERALRALAAEGAQITLIARQWEAAAEGSAPDYRRVVCDPPYARWPGGRVARDRSFALAATREMQAGNYDITQSHERIPGCMIFRAGDGVHAAWLRHRQPVLSAAGRLAQRWSPYHRYVLAAEAEMFAHPALRAVICNSRLVADEVRAHYGVPEEKLAVIYNGVDTGHFSPALAEAFRDTWRCEQVVDAEVPVLLFVGSGFERKGVPRLLRAMALMRRRDACLFVVGADRKLAAMRRLASSLGLAGRVRFTGPQPDVRPFYGGADAFVLPTLYDPGPNAALEALASGLPTLTTSTCGAREWIRDGQNGFVVDALDVPALAARLDDLCELAGMASARQAARAAVEGLTLPAMSARLLELYARCRGA